MSTRRLGATPFADFIDDSGRFHGRATSRGEFGCPNRAFRAPNQIVRKPLCRKQHGQYGGVGMADRIDTDAAPPSMSRVPSASCFHPRGAMLETQMRKPGQAARIRMRRLEHSGSDGMVSDGGCSINSAGG